jgi:hypothetical protein
MWNTVRSGNVFRGIMMNRKKNGETMLPRLIGEDIELIFVPAQDQ